MRRVRHSRHTVEPSSIGHHRVRGCEEVSQLAIVHHCSLAPFERLEPVGELSARAAIRQLLEGELEEVAILSGVSDAADCGEGSGKRHTAQVERMSGVGQTHGGTLAKSIENQAISDT